MTLLTVIDRVMAKRLQVHGMRVTMTITKQYEANTRFYTREECVTNESTDGIDGEALTPQCNEII